MIDRLKVKCACRHKITVNISLTECHIAAWAICTCIFQLTEASQSLLRWSFKAGFVLAGNQLYSPHFYLSMFVFEACMGTENKTNPPLSPAVPFHIHFNPCRTCIPLPPVHAKHVFSSQPVILWLTKYGLGCKEKYSCIIDHTFCVSKIRASVKVK